MRKFLFALAAVAVCLGLLFGASPVECRQTGEPTAAAERAQPVFVAGVESGGAGSRVAVREPPSRLWSADCKFVAGCSACVYQVNSMCNFRLCNSVPC